MKKIAFLLPLVLIWFLIGCEKTELEDINQEINDLQDSISTIIEQHNQLIDSVSALIGGVNAEDFDIKACKMEQMVSLFASMARQPEASELLIKATEMLYQDISVLYPISDKAIVERGKARGLAFGSLFESIARQPEAFNKLDSAATKFLGIYDPGYISDELLEITKAYSATAMNEAIARQPEADSLFNLVCTKYFNFDFLSSPGE